MTTDARLRSIEEKQDRLLELVTANNATHQGCMARQTEHHVTLYGNGNDGLKTRVERLETVSKVKRVIVTSAVAIVSALAAVGGTIWTVFEWVWRAKHG